MSSVAVQMNQFLMSVEKRAFRMAEMALGNPDDAMDIVQDSMMMLARKYAKRPADQWPPLFFRIVQNKIRDCYRRRASHNRVFAFFNQFRGQDDEALDVAELHASRSSDEPEQRASLDGATLQLQQALEVLPQRQQQAFLLRSWEGLNVAETALAMDCSQGSVKTHYSRAVHRLREMLGEHWP